MSASSDQASNRWPARHWRHLRRHPRFTACALLFIVLAVVLWALGTKPDRSVLLAFDLAAAVFLGATVTMFSRADAQSIRRRARREDEGYWGFLLSSAALAVVALLALAVELHSTRQAGGLQIALAVCSLILAWLFMNTMFALHYAHEFYGDDGTRDAGLDFPGNADPDYWDFVYFAFVIGMTFQVSDVQINARGIRRVALVQSVLAFFFNVIVIALSVNIVASQA
ncbi:MAG: DUF1345 domain-containing protein [Xanthomonadales bacterium]|nr:DUF1345 domain-containing protein [Xanthomonadales bacterium]